MAEKRGLDQKGLAAAVSLTHTAVFRWGKGGIKPTVANIEQLTRVLRCSPNAFFEKL